MSCLDITDQSYPCSQAEVIYVGRPKTLSFKVFYDEVDMLGDISDVAQTEAARRWQWRWEGRLWGYRTVGSGKRNGYMHHPPLVLSSKQPCRFQDNPVRFLRMNASLYAIGIGLVPVERGFWGPNMYQLLELIGGVPNPSVSSSKEPLGFYE